MRNLLFALCLLPLASYGQKSAIGWQTFSIGAPALQILLPGEPLPQNANLPEAVQSYIKKYEAFYYQDGKGLVVTLMHVVYSVDVMSDVKGAIDGTNGQWERTGSKVAVLSTTNNKINGKNAIQQRGKLINGGQENDYMDIVIGEGAKLWQVIVMVPSKDTVLQTTMQKIIDSISIK